MDGAVVVGVMMGGVMMGAVMLLGSPLCMSFEVRMRHRKGLYACLPSTATLLGGSVLHKQRSDTGQPSKGQVHAPGPTLAASLHRRR